MFDTRYYCSVLILNILITLRFHVVCISWIIKCLIPVIILDKFWKNTQMANCMEILPVGAELFRADRQIYMTKLKVAFRSFANASENQPMNAV